LLAAFLSIENFEIFLRDIDTNELGEQTAKVFCCLFGALRYQLLHVCQCERAARVQKQMQTLWRNRVPMCIEVLLFADCRHGQLRCSTTDIAPPDVSDSCILLEQWTIQNVARK